VHPLHNGMSDEMNEPVLQTAHDQGVVRLTLNRPDKLNAFIAELNTALHAALESAAGDPACRVVVITGAGRAFSAGQDLAELRALEIDVGDLLRRRYDPLLNLIRAMPKPVVAAVNGIAAGAGANLALACDIVVAAKSARFIQAFARIGLIPDAGGTWLLPRLVGEARARALAMLGEPLSAEQAASWGLIWKAVDDASFVAEIDALAAQLASAATHALGLQKRAFAAACGNDFATQLALEAELQREAASSADHAEGVSAFLEKRAPRFPGVR
jgi:2-(1,2-epoxy-1,2-dihydrophenyl)acetyl-CoA isomerase